MAQSADDAKPEYQPKLFRGPTAPGKNGAAASGKKVLATGTIEPEEVVDVCTQVAGPIVSLGADPHAAGKSIDYNSTVEVGTVLAQIDSQPYAIRVQRQQAACAGRSGAGQGEDQSGRRRGPMEARPGTAENRGHTLFRFPPGQAQL